MLGGKKERTCVVVPVVGVEKKLVYKKSRNCVTLELEESLRS